MFVSDRLATRILAVVLICAGSAASAQSFAVTLGERTLGTMVYSRDGGMQRVRSNLDTTPLGVFNGSFEGVSQAVSGGVQYNSASKSSRKGRDVAVTFAQGRAVETVITPDDERTELSDVAAVPADVIDPVATMGRFINAAGCPDAFRFYDGRRAVLVQPVEATRTADQLVCELSYRVSDGPGHLSPLYIKSVTIVLTYDVAGKQSLRQIQMGAAGFDLTMVRQ